LVSDSSVKTRDHSECKGHLHGHSHHHEGEPKHEHKHGEKGCSHDHKHEHEHDHNHNHAPAHSHDHDIDHICLLSSDLDFQKTIKKGNKALRKLTIVVVICFFFMIVEVIGGIASGSLAILTDAAHMLSDVGGFLISMFSIWIGQKAHNSNHTFGYHRAEVIGALASILIIWTMVIWLAWEATDRILYKHDFVIDA
jgi:Co/Zn/Cd efflux system component